MQILKEIDPAFIVSELQRGSIFILPTETSYGLCCDATNTAAVEQIYKIKKRSKDKPLLVVVDSVAAAQKILEWSTLIDSIAVRYWPGAVTVVGMQNSQASLAPGVAGKDGTVAVRVTANPLLAALTHRLSRPLVATSGNISDTGDTYDSQVAITQFSVVSPQPDYILAAGSIPKRSPSTIVSVLNNTLTVLRQGDVTVSK